MSTPPSPTLQNVAAGWSTTLSWWLLHLHHFWWLNTAVHTCKYFLQCMYAWQNVFSKALLLSHLKTCFCTTYIQMWVIWIMSTCLDGNKNSTFGRQTLLVIQNLTHNIFLSMRHNRKCTHACIHNGSISLIDVSYCCAAGSQKTCWRTAGGTNAGVLRVSIYSKIPIIWIQWLLSNRLWDIFVQSSVWYEGGAGRELSKYPKWKMVNPLGAWVCSANFMGTSTIVQQKTCFRRWC